MRGTRYDSNIEFVYLTTSIFFNILLALWLICLRIAIFGDVHPNPGPLSVSSDSSFTSSATVLSSVNLSRHLSFVHYNVQSILPKLDILFTELFEFDILAFSETWLNPSVSSNDLLQSFHGPERKDRTGDSHCGVMIYVKDAIRYKRRHDLEIIVIECLWIELTLKNKHILFGVFYRPPNSDSAYCLRIQFIWQ